MSVEWRSGRAATDSDRPLHQERFCVGNLTLDVTHDKQVIYQTDIQTRQTHHIAQHLNHPLAQQIERALQLYADDSNYSFELPLRIYGTDFQIKVWQAMLAIPAGETRTYGDVAKELMTAAQPIGGACKANPAPLFVPCHRIVAQQGIGGFSGQWGDGEKVELKRWLLTHERAIG